MVPHPSRGGASGLRTTNPTDVTGSRGNASQIACEHPKTTECKSYGVIMSTRRQNGEIRYLFLRGQNDENEIQKWSFPKGHLEYSAYHRVTQGRWTGLAPAPGAVPIECPQCCAIRETREETGITLRYDQLGYYCVRVRNILPVVEQQGEITGHAWATLEEQSKRQNNVDVQGFIKYHLSRR